MYAQAHNMRNTFRDLMLFETLFFVFLMLFETVFDQGECYLKLFGKRQRGQRERSTTRAPPQPGQARMGPHRGARVVAAAAAAAARRVAEMQHIYWNRTDF